MRGSSVPPGIGALKRQSEKLVASPEVRRKLITDLKGGEVLQKLTKHPKMDEAQQGISSLESITSAARAKSQPKKPPPSPLAKEAVNYIGALRTLGSQVICDTVASEPVSRYNYVTREDILDIPHVSPEEMLESVPTERRMLQGSRMLLKAWEELAQGMGVTRSKLEAIAEEVRQVVDIRLAVYTVMVCKVVVRILLKEDPTSDMLKEERVQRELQRAVRLGDLKEEEVLSAELRINHIRDRNMRIARTLDSEVVRVDVRSNPNKRGKEKGRGESAESVRNTKDEAPPRVRTQIGLLYSTDSEAGDSSGSDSSIGSDRGYGIAKRGRTQQKRTDESDKESRDSERSALSPRRERQRRDKEYLQALRATQPGKFRGEVAKPQLLVEWITQMSQYFSLMNLGRKEEVNIAISYLEKGASVWWNQVPDKKKGKIKTWPLFKEYIIREFLPHDYNLVLWRRLDDTKQRVSVAEYIERFQEVQRQILDIPEKISLTKFLNGLKSNIRGHVLALRPRTQREAMRLARNFDEAFFAKSAASVEGKFTPNRPWNRTPDKGRFSRVNVTEGSEVNGIDRHREKGPKEKEKSTQGAQKKQFKCFNCDKIGHMARDCWAPRKQFGKAAVNVTQVENESSLKAKPQSVRLTVYWGHIQGHKAEMLVDSGASTIFISEAFIRKNRLRTCKRPVPIRIDFAGLAEQISNRMVPNVQLALGTYKEILTFEIAAANYDVILGKSWLDDHHAEIVTNSHELYFESKGERHVIGKESLVGRVEVQATVPIYNDDEEAIQCDLIGGTPLKKLMRSRQGQIFSVRIVDKEKEEKEKVVVPVEYEGRVNELLERFKDTFHEAIPIKPEDQIHGVSHDIIIEGGSAPTVSPMYRLSSTELQELKKKVNELIERGHVRPSSSPYAAGVLFVPKKGGKLRMCIDYRQLNKITTKNRYPLPLIDELLEKLQAARIFSKMDLTDGYHHIPISEQDRPKTAFRTPMGLYEYTVMPFGLANAPATFQRFMNEIFRDMTEECLVVYMDDLLVHSKSVEEHQEHLSKVLVRLQEKKMCVKLSKSQFFQETVEFLGYVVGKGTVAPDPEKVKAIVEWPSPLPSVTAVRSFLGLAQFYKRFIPQFSEVAAPLTNLTKNEKLFEWGDAEQASFDQLKHQLAKLPKIFLPVMSEPFKMRVQTDASGFAVGAVLHQVDAEGKEIPVAYASRKLEKRELGRPVHEKEFIAIHFALTKWRHLLLGREFSVYTDHQSLQFFMSQKKLDARFARMAGFLAQFDLKINYKPGKENHVPDALSRRHDYELKVEVCNMQQMKRQTLMDAWQKRIRKAGYEEEYQMLLSACGKFHKIRQGRFWYQQGNGMLWVLKGEEWRLVVPSKLTQEVMETAHKGTVGACQGFLKTYADIRNVFHWRGMFLDVLQYIRKCSVCAQIKDATTALKAPLQSIPPAQERWQQISMDFISDLPRTEKGQDTILTVVDSLTKQAHFIPCKKTDSAREIAVLFRKEIWRHHGLPLVTISDRDTRFSCDFWRALHELLGVKTKFSSAFHPETDGQSERANRSVEQILRFYCTAQQERWDDYVEIAEFAYNSSVHATTGVAPFVAAYGYKPVMDLPDLRHSRNRSVEEQIQYMKEVKDLLQESIRKAQQHQQRQANKSGRKERELKVGDWIWLNTANLNMRTLQKKLAPRFVGPMKIIKKISDVAFQVETPRRWRIHNVFYIGLLKRYEGDTPEEETKQIPILTAGYQRYRKE